MGVVTGVVMPFQFGTNWSRFSDITANIVSPLLAYEGLTAFTLEAGFLGVLLFGRKLVPRWAHFCLRAAGGVRHPAVVLLDPGRPIAGCRRPAATSMVDGRFFPSQTGWRSSSIPPFPIASPTPWHAFYVTTGFVVLAVGAWLLPQKESCRRRQGSC